MSKLTLAFVSFVIGACCMFLLIDTSARVHAGQSSSALATDAEPVVPPLMTHQTGILISGPAQALDGIDCIRCTINTRVFTYAGGGFNCSECSVPSDVRIALSGAALNTLRMLVAFKALPSEPKPPVFTLPAPQTDKVVAQANTHQTVTLVSLEGIN
jgi:hypothetical protein